MGPQLESHAGRMYVEEWICRDAPEFIPAVVRSGLLKEAKKMRKKSSLERAEIIKVKLIGTLVLSLLLFSSVALVEASPDYDLLIIAPETFTSVLQPLVDHKEATEMPTLMITLENIYDIFDGADEPEKIKRAIEHYNQIHSIKYVMLVGDVDKFPVRWVTYEEPNQPENRTLYFPSDLYYADLYDEDGTFNTWNFDNDEYFGEHLESDRWGSDPYSVNADRADLHPDVAVGRVPASYIEEVESYVAKVIRYEYLTSDSASDWFHNVLLLAGASRKTGECDPGIHFNDIKNYLGGDFQYKIYIRDSFFGIDLNRPMRPCNCTSGESLNDCKIRTGLTEDQINIFRNADGFLWPDSSEFVNVGFLGWHGHTGDWANVQSSYRTRVNNSDYFTVGFSDGCGDGSFTVVPTVEMVEHGWSYMETGGRIIQIIFDQIPEDRDGNGKNETYYDVINCSIDGIKYPIDELLTMFPDIILHDDFDDYGNPVTRIPQYILNGPPPAPLQPITCDREFNPEYLLFAKNSTSGVETGWVGLVAATKGTGFTSNGELESLFFRSYNEPHTTVSDKDRVGDMWRSMLEYWLEEVVFDDTGNFDFTEYHDKYSSSICRESSKVGIQSTMMYALFGDPSLRVGGVPDLEDTEPPETTDDADRDWHNCDVTITLTATDDGDPPSGVRITNYSIDGGDWVTGNHLTIEAPSNHRNDGIHRIDYYSIDFLGNTEAVKNAEIKIDTYPPHTAVLLDGEPPAMVLCPCICPPDNPDCECECPKRGCYTDSVTVTLDATDYPPTHTPVSVSGVDYIEHDCCRSPYHLCGYTGPFDVYGRLREIITLKYWSVDNAGNVNWPPNEVTFCVSNWGVEAMMDEIRIFATIEEIIAIKMLKFFADTLPPINYVKFEYAGPYPTEQPDWVTMGVDHNGNDGWGIHWDTTNVPDGDYHIRMTVVGSEFRQGSEVYHAQQQDKVIYQEQLNVTVCNIPNSAYDFKLYAPDEIDRGEVIRYTLKFDNKMDRPLTNLNMIGDLDTGFFDKIKVLDNGYLNKQGMPTWFRQELKSGETWKVRFKGKTKPDIYPGMIITSQALITADTVPLLLSDDPTTPKEDDYTAVAIRLIDGSITGKVGDDKYGTAITASVAIDGAVTQNITTDGSGIYLFSDLPPGDYNVSVDAENYDYLSPTAPVTVTLDGTGASIQVDFFMARKDIIPPVSSILLSADEIVHENMIEIHGIAYDYAPGSGMSKVDLCIERNNDRKYWDGNSWERKETWLLALGTTEWTFKCSGITWDSNFSYVIKSRATDNAGNVERATVITTTSALQSPALISPANKISVGYVPTFEWSYVLDSCYYIQIDNDRYFRSPEIDASYLTHNTYTPGEMEKGTYYWRVKAVDMERGYRESEWSEVRTVTTTPGFETIFAIAGLLAVAFLLRRKK